MVRRVALLVSALVIAPLLTAVPAQSIPACLAGYQCTRIYYSDITYETPVGGYTRFCDGTTDRWGTTSAYVETMQAQCN
ncbi:DUF6289 family protein [Actinophytocola sp. KF-1]